MFVILDCRGSKYGPSIKVGAEMMGYLSHFDFRVQDTKLPMCRVALLSTMLTTKKHADGLSKIIFKADMDKMKGTYKDNTIKMEGVLKKGWDQMNQSSSSKPLAALAFGKLCVRMTLHLLSKEKFSRDAPFESFAKIVDQFHEDLLDVNLKASSSSSVAATPAQPNQKNAVQDMLNAKAADVAKLEHPHLEVAGLYVNSKEHGEKVFKLLSFQENHVDFQHQPLFEAAEKVEVPFKDLKQWKSTKKCMPTQCPVDVMTAKLTSTAMEAELIKAEVQSLQGQPSQLGEAACFCDGSIFSTL